MASTKARRRIHIGLALFFAVQVPLALAWHILDPASFDKFWKDYLIFLSLYAIVSTHWAGAAAETPMDDEAPR